MKFVLEELKTFVRENFLFGDEIEIGDSDSFLEAGIIDSTGVLNLIQYLEERYEIAIANEEVVPENLDSFSSITQFVERKLSDPGYGQASLGLHGD